eukprot:scaffold31144_cov47-Phaeocystis_antarctica.AAC.1
MQCIASLGGPPTPHPYTHPHTLVVVSRGSRPRLIAPAVTPCVYPPSSTRHSSSRRYVQTTQLCAATGCDASVTTCARRGSAQELGFGLGLGLALHTGDAALGVHMHIHTPCTRHAQTAHACIRENPNPNQGAPARLYKGDDPLGQPLLPQLEHRLGVAACGGDHAEHRLARGGVTQPLGEGRC